MTHVLTAAEKLHAAELRVQRARDQLHLTVGELQTRLDPRERAHRVAREAQVAGRTAVAVAKDKPGVIAGLGAAAVVFLARHRIARLFARKRPDASPQTAGLNPVIRTDA
jgi:hypothetical protein